MAGYLLDTNHLGAALKSVSRVRDQIVVRMRQGQRFGTCVPVLCELEAGFRPVGARRELYEKALRRLLGHTKIWPLEPDLAPVYGRIYQELRAAGRALSQVDIMLAALASQMKLTLLTSDRDFEAVTCLHFENWLSPS